MQTQPLLSHIEINFWNLFCYLLGRSSLVRRMVVTAYNLVTPQSVRKTLQQVGWLFGAGLLIGFIVALLQTL